MDTNLIFTTNSTSNAPSSGGIEQSSKLNPSISGPMSGQEFAGLMSDLMANVSRQDIAAHGSDAGFSLATSGLLTMSLGNQISLITTTSPQPDEISLAEFARSQGLGEMAVKALFGELLTNNSVSNIDLKTITSTETAPLKLGLGIEIASNSELNPSRFLEAVPIKLSFEVETPAATSDSALGSASLNNLLFLSQASGSIQSLTTGKPTSANPTSQPDLMANSGVSWPIGAPPNIPAQAISSGLMNAAQPVQTPQSAALLEASLIASSAFNQASSTSLESEQLDTSLQKAPESPEEMGPLDAMRLRMVPAWETMTRQLAKLNGSDTPMKWANLATQVLQKDNTIGALPQATLDLGDTDIGSDLLSEFNVPLSSTSTMTLIHAEPLRSSQSLISPTSANALALPNLEERGSQIQQLADKLGLALSERLIDQIEKGQWRMHLKLNPGHLGSIDVELDMHSGGLDALFKTDNTLTRELIAQGMAKLKEGLAQSGMAVANVWVNSDSQRESGGNSTPRQNNSHASNVKSVEAETQSLAVNHKDLRSAEGWDTLA